MNIIAGACSGPQESDQKISTPYKYNVLFDMWHVPSVSGTGPQTSVHLVNTMCFATGACSGVRESDKKVGTPYKYNMFFGSGQVPRVWPGHQYTTKICLGFWFRTRFKGRYAYNGWGTLWGKIIWVENQHALALWYGTCSMRRHDRNIMPEYHF